jgi:hypothetical protein
MEERYAAHDRQGSMSRTWALLASFLVLAVAACGDAAATPSAGGSRIEGTALAGPVCPVERPGDPACAPRPIAGALVIVRGVDGAEVARATTDADGRYQVAVAPGRYTVEGAPVEGLMGNPTPIDVDVGGDVSTIDIQYDTGIR